MYVTRPLSMYKKSPEDLSLPPPEGPNSGILVIQDEEAETTCCFGLCKSHELLDMPLPQNKNLTLRYVTQMGESQHVSHFYTAFIPVLNQPLASNRYYAIQSRGKLEGQAYTCSTDENLGTCCFCTYVRDVPSQPFNPNNIYQQYEIQQKGSCNQFGGFVAKSIASDGPLSMYKKSPEDLSLPPPEGPNSGILVIQDEEAETTCCFGLCKSHELLDMPLPQNKNLTLRYVTQMGQSQHVSHFYTAFIPGLNQPLASNRYYAIQSRGKLEGQAYTCSTDENLGTCCFCTYVKDVPSQPFNPNNIYQQYEIQQKGSCNQFGGFVAKSIASDGYPPKFLGRKGWEINTSTPRDFHLVEEFGGVYKWRKFGCYVLVERFVLKRMDGSLVLTYDFRHTHHIRSTWE
ncbi:hypothetical protein C1H46_039250 [Malus baccata]|uniref:Uncharacterized protein n=1 Tax=Malus baccata TaxID=106549 RepID=A0A540KM15_MALBA|nr:hypothetical protein C1H46_039250 [Malus baccata]